MKHGTKHLVKYERNFIAKCKELKFPVKFDEDSSPFIRVKGKYRKLIHLCPWGGPPYSEVNKFGIVVMSKHARTLENILEQIKQGVPQSEWNTEPLNTDILDTEAIVVIDGLDNLTRLIIPLSIKVKKTLTAEQKEKATSNLAECRANSPNK